MDITQLVLDDHHEQRRLFAILEQMDPGDSEKVAAVWKRLAVLLDLHAKAEEELFYPALLKLSRGTGGDHTPEAETEDAIHDHNEIRDAVAAVDEYPVGSEGWYEALAAANKANGDHMAEEEREGLTDFRRHASLQTRHDLGIAFIGFEAEHAGGVKPEDKNPQEYIDAHTHAG